MLTPIQQLRIAVGDTDITFPILDDLTYEYFLSKNNGSVTRASIDAAKTILFQLSLRTDETVDIFSVKGSKAAEQYRLSLQLLLRDPTMNPFLSSANIYGSGISKTDMISNISNTDNNSVNTPLSENYQVLTDPFKV